MKQTILVLALLFLTTLPALSKDVDEQERAFALDENVWVLFYDVPSRRFRRIRDAFVRRNWDVVAADLKVSAGFLRAEASRAPEVLVAPIGQTADRLEEISNNIQTSKISGSDLDAIFARAHWLLAQHYLELSVAARDAGKSRNAGSYLWATVHHMERTVLWSDARMSRAQVRSLDRLRDLADRLRDADDPTRVYKERPIALARKTLADLGVFLDRKVWLETK